jgi:uronate dehydrogenase
MRTVLVTGAAGGIGTRLRELLKGVYPQIRWSDIRPLPGLARDETFVQADLADLAQVENAVEGRTGLCISAVSRWSIRGTPSSTPTSSAATTCSRPRAGNGSNALSSPPRTMPWDFIRAGARSESTSPYARTPATASARHSARRSARSMRTSTGCASLACASATSAMPRSISGGWRSGSSPRISWRSSVSASSIRFEIFFGASDNERAWWDNEPAFRYGYRPTGRAEDYAAAALAAQQALPADRVGDWYQGGPFCSAEFDGVPELAAT